MREFIFSIRKAERDAFCRACDGPIKKGEDMMSGYSHRNRGQNIHFHLDCVGQMNALVKSYGEQNGR